jgi:predicted regulator of Ras-like GTPase activity (Roadblock/LC7/MglB family)
MALEGNLEEFNIVAVLQTIAGGRLSGKLAVWDAVQRAEITFIQGLIIHAESTLESDRLGEILVRTHRITRGQLERAMTLQLRQQPGARVGQILLEMAAMTEDDLSMAVEIQILEVTSRLLLWSRGRWQFVFEPPTANDKIPAGAVSLDDVLSGQVMLIDTLDTAHAHNEMLDEIYTIVPTWNRESDRIILKSDEWRVLSSIDGKATVRQIAERVAMEPEIVCQVITDLLAVHLLARGEGPALTVPPPAAPAAPLPPYPGPLAMEAPAPPPSPASSSSAPLPTAHANSTVVARDTLPRIQQVLAVLLLRTEGKEVCLIDSSGSLIARQGGEVHSDYETLFALAASIFASWQELGRSLGESKASTLLYQGSGLNICLTPVGTRAILMTLYQQGSNGGLVNFWSREASARIGRLLDSGVPAPSPGRPVDPATARIATAQPARNGNGEMADELNSEFQAEIARQMEDLFRE